MTAISIIVPVYNVEAYIDRCLNSLIYQKNFDDYEIICINDGSTDNSGKILETFAKQCNKIKLINQENKGLSEARNEGLKHAEGKYTLFVDSDDFIAANALSLLYNYAEEHKSDVVIFDMHTGSSDLKIQNTTRWKNIIDKYGDNSFNIQTAEPFVYRFVPVAAWNKFYLTELIKPLKFIKDLTCEDVPYWALVYSKAKRVNYLPLPLYFYVIDRKEAISKNTNKKVFDVITAFEAAKQTLIEANCYEKLKYIHFAHFASNLTVHLRNISPELREEFIEKIKAVRVDIDYNEFFRQDFFQFEKRDMQILKIIKANDFRTIEIFFNLNKFWA